MFLPAGFFMRQKLLPLIKCLWVHILLMQEKRFP